MAPVKTEHENSRSISVGSCCLVASHTILKNELLTSPSFEKIRILSILFLTTQQDPRKFPASTAVPVLAFPSSYLKVPILFSSTGFLLLLRAQPKILFSSTGFFVLLRARPKIYSQVRAFFSYRVPSLRFHSQMRAFFSYCVRTRPKILFSSTGFLLLLRISSAHAIH